MNKEIWTCTVCGNQTPPIQATACPKCGSRNIPLSSKNDVTVNINVQELRVILYWAEYWAEYCAKTEKDTGTMQRVVTNIANKLTPQLPKGTVLTLSQDFAQLKEAFPTAETTFGVDENPPKKPKTGEKDE